MRACEKPSPNFFLRPVRSETNFTASILTPFSAHIARNTQLVLQEQGYRLLNKGVGFVGFEEARWVEFQDANGINNHIWYVCFNETGDLLIIQSKISVLKLEKYGSLFKRMIDSMKVWS